LPATQAQKKKRLTEIFGSPPDWVGYAPIDFNTQSLEEVLKEAGYDLAKKTSFVWEGVTYFIAEGGVDSTLRFIAQHSAPGSSVVFDYTHRSVIDGDFSECPQVHWLFRRMADQGEPYIFGIPRGKAEGFVNQRGLEVLSDLGPDELTERYLVRSDDSVDGPTARFVRIMHAQVPARTKPQPGLFINGPDDRAGV
jgi:methyltransferase (TIGR00027 family)